MGVNVFGGAAPAAVPFAEGGDGDEFVLGEHADATLILEVEGIEQIETKQYGVKPAAKLTRVVSLKPGAEPRIFEDVLIFQSAPVSQLKRSAGQTVVAAVTTYESKFKNTAYKFETPSAAQLKAAEKFLAAEAES